MKTGDQFIFEEVFRQHHEKIYFYVLGKTGSPYLAEEAAQLTFIKLWEYRSSLSETHSLFTQIFRIARTTMIDLLRKQENQASLANESPQATMASANAVWEPVMEKELKSRLIQALDQMPPVRKRVFTMSRMDGMSLKEIAATLSLSVKTVEGHISLAIKQIRNHLTIFLLIIILLFF